jgi:internalin A
MSELALQLIEQNKQSKEKFLDLNNCGLTALPTELLECIWLEKLNLGNYSYVTDKHQSRKYNSSVANDFQLLENLDLDHLKNLKTLDLSDTNFSNLYLLGGVTNLEDLSLSENVITDITSLQPLVNLQSMDLSENRITDLLPLGGLVRLTNLNLDDNEISDLSILKGFGNLLLLNVSDNKIDFISHEWVSSFAQIMYLNLSNNPIINIPKEIFDQNNCLTDLKNYFKDKSKESIPVHEAKIILAGNGRVGKTCLVKRLLDNTFSPDEPSTHAIQIREWELSGLAEDTGLKKLKANVWDFGGQDIYHATHRLFMNTKALFLLVWDKQTESAPLQTEVLSSGRTLTYRNNSLLYWLNYIKSLSSGSPVLVVQSQMQRDGKLNPPLSEEEKREYNVWATLSIDSGLGTANGFRSLKASMEEIITKQIQTTCTEIPSQWYRVKEQTEQLQSQAVKQLPLEGFKERCTKEGLDESSTQTLLGYLHSSGVLFYKEGLFGGQIVIDQKWAIDAVYALFDRRKGLVRNSNGQFAGYDLAEIWEDKTEDEQQLFVSFMKECEMCYEVNESENKEKEVPFKEKKFIAPQLLPEDKPNALSFAFDGKDEVWFKYQHYFLHGAIIQRLIVRLGFLADKKEMWQEGILIKTEKGIALIESFAEECRLLIRIKGSDYKELLSVIDDQLKIITEGEEGIKKSVSLDGNVFVSLEKINHQSAYNEQIQAEDGTWVGFSDYLPFITLSERIARNLLKARRNQKTAIQNDIPAVFFSYAWGEEREKNVDALYDSLKTDGFTVVRDKVDLKYGKSISQFMQEIGKGSFVMVFISDKYLKSDNCMYELYEVFRRSELETEELRRKIYPIRIENINLNDPAVRRKYYEHWKQLEAETKTNVNDYGEDQSKLRKIEAIKIAIRDFLLFLEDTNALTPELLSENNFEVIKKKIRERAKEISSA